MAACSRNCKSWSSATKDAKHTMMLGKWAELGVQRLSLNRMYMETSEGLGLGPKGSWAQKANSGGRGDTRDRYEILPCNYSS